MQSNSYSHVGNTDAFRDDVPLLNDTEIFCTMESALSTFRSLSGSACMKFASLFTEGLALDHQIRSKQELLEACAADQQTLREKYEDIRESQNNLELSSPLQENPGTNDTPENFEYIQELHSVRAFISRRCAQLSEATREFNRCAQPTLFRIQRAELQYSALMKEHNALFLQHEMLMRRCLESHQDWEFATMHACALVIYQQILIHDTYTERKEHLMNLSELEFLRIKKQIFQQKLEDLQKIEAEERMKHDELKSKITRMFFPPGFSESKQSTSTPKKR